MGMVATSPLVLAPAPTSGLIRLRSGHHYEVRLGLGIVFMYNMSIYEAFWGPSCFRPSRRGWRHRRTSGQRCVRLVVTRRPRRSHRHGYVLLADVEAAWFNKKKKSFRGRRGAGGCQDASASIRSSPDGQAEAIDTPTTLLLSLQVHMQGDNPVYIWGFLGVGMGWWLP